jgi:hypothetical protein
MELNQPLARRAAPSVDSADTEHKSPLKNGSFALEGVVRGLADMAEQMRCDRATLNG